MISTRASAKVNLVLRVRGRRSDGYHELWTIFDELELADDLAWEPTTTGDLHLVVEDQVGGGLSVPTGPDNLVLRAAHAFHRATGHAVAGRLRLTKRIPSGAGLGGGSSDAAAMLRLAAERKSLDPRSPELTAIAREVGADVPFFLVGGRAWASGRGDEIHPMQSEPPLHYALLFPGYPCATRDVFARWQGSFPDMASPLDSRTPVLSTGCATPGVEAIEDPHLFLEHLLPGRREGFAHGLFNDLEAAAMEACPQLARLRERLHEAAFTVVHLSGSGSTLFLAGGSPKQMKEIADRLGDLVSDLLSQGHPGIAAGARVFLTRSRGTSPPESAPLPPRRPG